ncbi:MAG: hypothetical protein HYZ43_16230, partial [Flavobacteriia bacterium]|nr:hypothetical protein [Flavobacteriia bacterium]
MKKVIIIILSYSLVFVVGYLTVGIILHFAKPEVKMLPAFIENALPEVEKEDQLSLQQQSLEGMDYHLLTPADFDTTVPIYFNEHYSEENGIFCFRGNAQRNRPTRGTISGKPTTIELDWVFETAYDSRMTDFGVWGGGSGWTGQPLIVRWPEEQRKQLFEL